MTRTNTPEDTFAAMAAADLVDETMTFSALQLLAGDIGTVHATLLPTSRRKRPTRGTPIMGEGATERWIALHDRATSLRATLIPGDGVAARQVQRAVHSLFLYEHQLTAKTRRRARTILWQREERSPMPPFVDRIRWAKCRCQECQPASWAAAASILPANTLRQTA